MDGTLQAGNEHAVHSLMRLRAVGRAFGTSKTARKRGSAALQPLGRLVSNTPMREHRRWGCWRALHNLYSKRTSTLAALLPSILSKRLANASKTAKNAIERTRTCKLPPCCKEGGSYVEILFLAILNKKFCGTARGENRSL